MVSFPPLSLEVLLRAVRGSVVQAPNGAGVEITSIAEPSEASSGSVSFLISEAFLKDLKTTRASAVVVSESLLVKARAQGFPEDVSVVISSPDAYLGLAELSAVLAKSVPGGDWTLHEPNGDRPSGCEIDASAQVSPRAVLGVGVKIGPRTQVFPGVILGDGVSIGADCRVFPGAILYPQTQVGNRVRLHANTVIGSDGFGYARGPRGSVKIWHLGRVVIQDDVEIGAGTTIDRGTLKDTVIEQGAKIDNLVQIGHNGHVRSHAILCAQVGLAGNVTVGRGAILAGKVGIADKVEIGDGAIVGPMSGLSKDLKAGEVVMGNQPAKPRREWWKLVAYFERLPELFDRVKVLERGPKCQK